MSVAKFEQSFFNIEPVDKLTYINYASVMQNLAKFVDVLFEPNKTVQKIKSNNFKSLADYIKGMRDHYLQMEQIAENESDQLKFHLDGIEINNFWKVLLKIKHRLKIDGDDLATFKNYDDATLVLNRSAVEMKWQIINEREARLSQVKITDVDELSAITNKAFSQEEDCNNAMTAIGEIERLLKLAVQSLDVEQSAGASIVKS